MNKFYSVALAAAFLAVGTLGTAIADPGHGNGNGNGHGEGAAAHVKASATTTVHGNSSHAHTMTTVHGNSAKHRSSSERNESSQHGHNSTMRGNSSTAHNCVNPAGNKRGWCKGNGTYHGRYGHTATSISGTVTAINGNTVTFLRDNGSTITVLDNNGTVLNVGGHYTLVGHMVNGQFVLGANNNNFGQSNQTVSGTIMSVGNGTITLIGLPPVTINVQQAINNGATNGALSVGRSITAYGYYSNNVFYATAIQ